MTRARTLSSVLTVNTSFDANTLFIDVDNNRIGINNGAPTDELTVTGNVSFSGFISGNGFYLSSVAASTLGGNTVQDILTAANTLASDFSANAYANSVSAANTLAFDFSANAYANAVAYANTISDTAYTNAVSAANTLAFDFAANAYSNAVSYANTISDTAYTNAVSQANTLAFNFAANAYANATSYTDTAISNLVNSAPSALDTLFELANALGNDANFSTTVLTGIGNAYTNAVAQANTLAFDFAANAYANAIAYSSNADNITSGTLDSVRLQANVDVTVQLSVGNTTVNSVVNSTSINTNTIVVGNVEQTQTNLQVDPAGTAFLNALIYG